MEHIYDNVGIDAQGAIRMIVPHSVNLGSFPSAATQKGGWRLDAATGDMLWSDGSIWRRPGTVSNFVANDLSPLFTTSVATPTTTPVLSFALSNVSQYQVFGRSAAGSGVPSWVTMPSTAFTGYVSGTGISIIGNVIASTASPVAWADKRLAFGQTSFGGLTYDSYIKYDYTKYSFTIGSRSAGAEGLYSAVFGINNLNSDNYTFQIGDQLSNTSGAGNLNIGNNNTLTSAFFSGVIGKTISYTGYYSIIGGISQSVNGSNNAMFGGYNTITGSFNLVSGVNHSVTGDRNFVHGYLNTVTHTGVTMISDANYTGTTASTVDNQFIGRFLNGYIFKLTASNIAVAINSSGQIVANYVPSSPSSNDIVVLGAGNILSTRTLASLGIPLQVNIIPGTGIGVSGSYPNITVTNTSPSKWTEAGSVISPITSGTIRTKITASYGYASMTAGNPSVTGTFALYDPSGNRIGLIGYTPTYMNYVAEIGNHRFSGGSVQLGVIPSAPSATDILVSNGGVISYRALSSISIGSDVWRITGGNTIATSITDSIWHNGALKLGNGASGSNSYMLQVVGTSYYTQTMLINNSTAFQAFNASASPVEVFKVDGSNNWLFAASHIKVNATDIYFDQYPNTRLDSFYTVPAARLMYTDLNGKILLTDKKAFYNDHVSTGSKAQQGQTADSTWRRLTNNGSLGTLSVGSQFGTNGSTSAAQIPRTDQQFWLVTVIEYENQSGTSGTPAIDVQIRINGSTTGVVFSDWSVKPTVTKDLIMIQSVLTTTGGGGYYDVDIYIRVATGSGSIYVNKHDTVITNVGYIGT